MGLLLLLFSFLWVFRVGSSLEISPASFLLGFRFLLSWFWLELGLDLVWLVGALLQLQSITSSCRLEFFNLYFGFQCLLCVYIVSTLFWAWVEMLLYSIVLLLLKVNIWEGNFMLWEFLYSCWEIYISFSCVWYFSTLWKLFGRSLIDLSLFVWE